MTREFITSMPQTLPAPPPREELFTPGDHASAHMPTIEFFNDQILVLHIRGGWFLSATRTRVYAKGERHIYSLAEYWAPVTKGLWAAESPAAPRLRCVGQLLGKYEVPIPKNAQ